MLALVLIAFPVLVGWAVALNVLAATGAALVAVALGGIVGNLIGAVEIGILSAYAVSGGSSNRRTFRR